MPFVLLPSNFRGVMCPETAVAEGRSLYLKNASSQIIDLHQAHAV